MYRYAINFTYKFLLSFIALTFCYQALANVINDCQESIQYPKEALIKWPNNQDKYPIDNNFWLTVEQAHLLQGDAVWIDVRSKLNQKNNSLNILTIPLDQLEGKSFLIDKKTVLVGTGFDQLLINKTINTLKAKGFKHVFALLGGISAWSVLKQANTSIPEEISPEEFLLGGKTIAWEIITIGLTEKDIQKLPEKPIKRFDLSQESILALKHFLESKPTNQDDFIRYVLITPNEQVVLLYKQSLNLTDSPAIVWLKGGLVNYQQYVKQQTHLINSAGQSLSKLCRLNF